MKLLTITYVGIVFLLTTQFSAKANANYKIIADSTKEESWISDNVYKLKEVRQKAIFLTKIKGAKARISILIRSRPSTLNPNYDIQVGYSSKIRFEVYYNFRINKTFVYLHNIQNHIEIADLNGQYISLLKWRKLNKL
ncbi:hypothetical protein PQ469_02070 [Mucilaginibacter sp. KACC 22773]|uniref:hypothetical protein n=1 Tax=Mucilaginibacter sp. KACC 22773 TaxID=3025671 RepID=UPI0023665BC7|nr:hypothetical protein [Mucilaginibacter sp. KACC 22773]WDF78792.1 hypothetical protein PQ469_02070 [Mucilaginibacter sp. KACC 22773]